MAQRTLSRAGRPGDDDELPGMNRGADSAHRVDRRAAALGKSAAHAARFEDGSADRRHRSREASRASVKFLEKSKAMFAFSPPRFLTMWRHRRRVNASPAPSSRSTIMAAAPAARSAQRSGAP